MYTIDYINKNRKLQKNNLFYLENVHRYSFYLDELDMYTPTRSNHV